MLSLLHALQSLLSGFLIIFVSRSNTWRKDMLHAVEKDGVRVCLNKLVYGTRQDMLDTAEGAD